MIQDHEKFFFIDIVDMMKLGTNCRSTLKYLLLKIIIVLSPIITKAKDLSRNSNHLCDIHISANTTTVSQQESKRSTRKCALELNF